MEIEGRAVQPLVRRFMPELDVQRGLAILGVVFFTDFVRIMGSGLSLEFAIVKMRPVLHPSPGHFNLIVLRFVVVSFIAIDLSFISRRYYEGWFLRLKDRFAPQPARKRKTLVVPPPSARAHELAESLTR